MACASNGCPEFAHFEFTTRSEQTAHYRKVTSWRCLRHSRVEEVLSLEHRRIEFTSVPSATGYVEVGYDRRRVPTGIYWGSAGFLSGPGFMAWAKDFPEGTRIKVTAEVLPSPTVVEESFR